MTTRHPILKTFLVVLQRPGPRLWNLEDLWQEARTRLATARTLPDERDPSLAEAPLRLYRVNMVALHRNPPRFAVEPGERPVGSPLARLQAKEGPRVTNLRHRFVDLSGFDDKKALGGSWYGTRDRAALCLPAESRSRRGSRLDRFRIRPAA